MNILKKRKKSLFQALLSILLFLSNVVFSYSLETNFWKDRQSALSKSKFDSSSSQQWARLPSALPAISALPVPKNFEFEALGSIQARSNTLNNKFATEFPFISEIPFSLGAVRVVRRPVGSSNGKTVLLIQDIHQNLEAQKNIGLLIQTLIDKEKLGFVGLEGNFESINLNEFRLFPKESRVSEAAEKLFSEKMISGPIWGALNSTQQLPEIVGIDSRELHSANIKAYLSSQPQYSIAQIQLQIEKKKNQSNKEAYLSSSLKELDHVLEAHRNKTISLGTYIQNLSDFSLKNKITFPKSLESFKTVFELEKSLNFKVVESERSYLIQQLVDRLSHEENKELLKYSQGFASGETSSSRFYSSIKDICLSKGIDIGRYQHFDAFIRYSLISDEIQPDKIFSDLNSIENDLIHNLSKTENEIVLMKQSRRISLALKLIDFSLSSEEWDQYLELKKDTSFDFLKPFESFYMLAKRRDAQMAINFGNSFYAELPKDKSAHIYVTPLPGPLPASRGEGNTNFPRQRQNVIRRPHDSNQNAVLVVGGFHREGLGKELRRKGFTVIDFVPRLTQVSETEPSALTFFAQEKTPLDKLFEGEKLFLAPDPMSSAAKGTLGLMSYAAARAAGIRKEIVGPILEKIAGLKILKEKITSHFLEITLGFLNAQSPKKMVVKVNTLFDRLPSVSMRATASILMIFTLLMFVVVESPTSFHIQSIPVVTLFAFLLVAFNAQPIQFAKLSRRQEIKNQSGVIQVPEIELTIDEISTYFGSDVAHSAKEKKWRFYMRKLNPKNDGTFINKWKHYVSGNKAKFLAWKKRAGVERGLPYFNEFIDPSYGLISLIDGVETLEGYMSIGQNGEGFSKSNGKKKYSLFIHQMELHPKNVGNGAQLTGIADLLWDISIKYVVESKQFSEGIKFSATTPGGMTFADRRKLNSPGIGYARGSNLKDATGQYDDLKIKQRFNQSIKPLPEGIDNPWAYGESGGAFLPIPLLGFQGSTDFSSVPLLQSAILLFIGAVLAILSVFKMTSEGNGGTVPPTSPGTKEEADASKIAQLILDSFDSYIDEFDRITSRAESRFRNREWQESVQDAVERIDLYPKKLDELEKRIVDIVGSSVVSPATWEVIKERFLSLIKEEKQANGHAYMRRELGMTFFYSVERRVFKGKSVEYADDGISESFDAKSQVDLIRFERPATQTLAEFLRNTYSNFGFNIPWADQERDIRLSGRLLEKNIGSKEISAIELLRSPFYRNKGAYRIGKIIFSDGSSTPVAFSFLNKKMGLRMDAILLGEDQVSSLFGHSRNNFHVEAGPYKEFVAYLKNLMPRRDLPSLLMGVGYIHPAKLEVVKMIRAALSGSDSKWGVSPGTRGAVMNVIAIPGFPFVIKIPRDDSIKENYRGKLRVIEAYQKVHRSDRVGRMLDPMRFRNLEFDVGSFEPLVLEDLLDTSGTIVRRVGNKIIIKDLFVQRKVVPLDVYLFDNSIERSKREVAIIEFGNTLRDLAKAGLYPDISIKNFGVNQFGRVSLFDFDDIENLTEINIKQRPLPQDAIDQYASDENLYIAEDDFYPEKLGIPLEFREIFSRYHADLLTAQYWRKIQRNLREGHVYTFKPHPVSSRLATYNETDIKPVSASEKKPFLTPFRRMLIAVSVLGLAGYLLFFQTPVFVGSHSFLYKAVANILSFWGFTVLLDALSQWMTGKKFNSKQFIRVTLLAAPLMAVFSWVAVFLMNLIVPANLHIPEFVRLVIPTEFMPIADGIWSVLIYIIRLIWPMFIVHFRSRRIYTPIVGKIRGQSEERKAIMSEVFWLSRVPSVARISLLYWMEQFGIPFVAGDGFTTQFFSLFYYYRVNVGRFFFNNPKLRNNRIFLIFFPVFGLFLWMGRLLFSFFGYRRFSYQPIRTALSRASPFRRTVEVVAKHGDLLNPPSVSLQKKEAHEKQIKSGLLEAVTHPELPYQFQQDNLPLIRQVSQSVFTLAVNAKNQQQIKERILQGIQEGAKAILVVSGGHPIIRLTRKADFTHEMDSIAVLQLVKTMKENGEIPTDFPFWAVGNPNLFNQVKEIERFREKVSVGAHTILTQPPFHWKRFLRWMKKVQEIAGTSKVDILVGVPIIKSRKNLFYWLFILVDLNPIAPYKYVVFGQFLFGGFREGFQLNRIAGHNVIYSVFKAASVFIPLTQLGNQYVGAYSEKWALDLVKQLRHVEGVAGVHYMPMFAWKTLDQHFQEDIQQLVNDFSQQGLEVKIHPNLIKENPGEVLNALELIDLSVQDFSSEKLKGLRISFDRVSLIPVKDKTGKSRISGLPFSGSFLIRRYLSEPIVTGNPIEKTDVVVDIRKPRDPPSWIQEFRSILIKATAPPQDIDTSLVPLEDFKLLRESIIWKFGAEFWEHVHGWMKAHEIDYRSAIGGSPDMDPQFIEGQAEEFFNRTQQKEGPLFFLEIGVASPDRAIIFLQKIRSLSDNQEKEKFLKGYSVYHRLTYLLGDRFKEEIIDPSVLEVKSKLPDAKIEGVLMDASNPFDKSQDLNRYRLNGFGVIDGIHVCNVYDTLPSDKIVVRNGKFYRLEVRAVINKVDVDSLRKLEMPESIKNDLEYYLSQIQITGPEAFFKLVKPAFDAVGMTDAYFKFRKALWDYFGEEQKEGINRIRLEERVLTNPAPIMIVSPDRWQKIKTHFPGARDPHFILNDLLSGQADGIFPINVHALEGFLDTLTTLSPGGEFDIVDVIAPTLETFRERSRGPQKTDGSLYMWLNGPLFEAFAKELGFEVEYRAIPKKSTMRILKVRRPLNGSNSPQSGSNNGGTTLALIPDSALGKLYQWLTKVNAPFLVRWLVAVPMGAFLETVFIIVPLVLKQASESLKGKDHDKRSRLEKIVHKFIGRHKTFFLSGTQQPIDRDSISLEFLSGELMKLVHPFKYFNVFFIFVFVSIFLTSVSLFSYQLNGMHVTSMVFVIALVVSIQFWLIPIWISFLRHANYNHKVLFAKTDSFSASLVSEMTRVQKRTENIPAQLPNSSFAQQINEILGGVPLNQDISSLDGPAPLLKAVDKKIGEDPKFVSSFQKGWIYQKGSHPGYGDISNELSMLSIENFKRVPLKLNEVETGKSVTIFLFGKNSDFDEQKLQELTEAKKSKESFVVLVETAEMRLRLQKLMAGRRVIVLLGNPGTFRNDVEHFSQVSLKEVEQSLHGASERFSTIRLAVPENMVLDPTGLDENSVLKRATFFLMNRMLEGISVPFQHLQLLDKISRLLSSQA